MRAYCILAALVTCHFVSGPTRAAGAEGTAEIRLAVNVAADGGRDVPVSAKVELPAGLAKVPADQIAVTVKPASGGQAVPGQVVRTGGQAELWWIMPEAKAGQGQWTAVLSRGRPAGGDAFSFRDEPGKHLDVLWGGRVITRYMYEFDRSTKDKALETNRTFHHIFDLAGKDPITKGAAGFDAHHRGVHIGWSRVTCEGKRYDFWGMSGGTAQAHKKFLDADRAAGLAAASPWQAGPVLARFTAQIDWQDAEGKAIISAEQQVMCFRQSQPGIALLEFRTRLRVVAGEVALDGDPEHAGFQYRAHNDVAVAAGTGGGKQTADAAPDELKTLYEFHREGIKTPAQKLNDNLDLPWAAQSYGLRGKRYSVQHMNHPSNPKPTVYSAYRPYGRFGACFKATIKAGEVLPLVYRIYAAESPMPPRDEMNLRHAAFANPPTATAAAAK